VTAAYQQDEAEDAVLGSRRGDELPPSWRGREDPPGRLSGHAPVGGGPRRTLTPSVSTRRAEAERQRTGQKRRGKVPKPVVDAPTDNAQSNFTDPEMHIMPTNNKGWITAATRKSVSTRPVRSSCL